MLFTKTELLAAAAAKDCGFNTDVLAGERVASEIPERAHRSDLCVHS